MRNRQGGMPGVVVATLAIGCAGPEASEQLAFEDITEQAAVEFTHHASRDEYFPNGTGVALGDCDGDGALELFVTDRQGPNVLFRRRGDGTFADEAAAAGVADPDGDSLGAAFADYDNDGLRDLFVARNGPNRLYRNLGDCRFEDVSAQAGLGFDGSTQSAAFGDYDGDGLLDLAWVNHTQLPYPPLAPIEPARQDHLLHNEGDGSFRDVSHLLGPERLLGTGFAVTWTDLDGDRDLDLVMINDVLEGGHRHQVFRNDGPSATGWRFTEVGVETGLGLEMNGMGIAVADYDNDADLDVLITNIGDLALLRSRGDGTFEDVAAEAGLDIGLVNGDQWVTWGAVFVDFDLDGWLDLYVAGGGLEVGTAVAGQPNGIFRNRGDGTFEHQPQEGDGLLRFESSRAVARGDVDGDGRPELYVVGYDGRGHLLRSLAGDGRHWLVVDVAGMGGAPDGIGATVRVDAGGLTQLHEVRSGSSLGAGSDPAAYFGLGGATRVERLEVRWPSGATRALEDLPVDRRISVTPE